MQHATPWHGRCLDKYPHLQCLPSSFHNNQPYKASLNLLLPSRPQAKRFQRIITKTSSSTKSRYVPSRIWYDYSANVPRLTEIDHRWVPLNVQDLPCDSAPTYLGLTLTPDVEELQKKKQSDVLRFLLRVRCWEVRQPSHAFQ